MVKKNSAEKNSGKIRLQLVHEPRAEIWLIGTTRGGKCYHTFSESLECQLSE